MRKSPRSINLRWENLKLHLLSSRADVEVEISENAERNKQPLYLPKSEMEAL